MLRVLVRWNKTLKLKTFPKPKPETLKLSTRSTETLQLA